MLSIIYWIIGVLFDSIWGSFWKKAIDSGNLSWVLFKLFSPLIWVIFIGIIIIFSWFESEIFKDYYMLWLLIFIIFLWYVKSLWEQNIMKNLKLSDIIPYSKTDKIFIILIWFFLYSGSSQETSITTLLISLLTIIVVISFSIDFKNIRFPKYIWSYLLIKLISTFIVIWTWYILLNYNSITYTALKILIMFVLCITTIVALRQSIKPFYNQSKTFYINRIWWTLICRIWFILWLFIIEKQWIVVATLLGFLWLVFNIFWMKRILKDNPSVKQVSLWVIVTIMIWIWYYFK